MNSITIAGALGKDSELRSIPSGEQVLSFSVADSQGRDKPTIWWNCQPATCERQSQNRL